MRIDPQSEYAAQRLAFGVLTNPGSEVVANQQQAAQFDCKVGARVIIPNKYSVNPINVTMPATLTQEIPWVNTNQLLSFDFSINGPVQTPGTNNNILLGKNNVAVIYAMQILFGEGANSANRIYRSFGNTPNDDSLYNSVVQIKMEQSTLVDKVDGRDFRDAPDVVTAGAAEFGKILINPVRIVTGELGFFSVFINLLNPISALVITANMFVSMRLKIGFGQASA